MAAGGTTRERIQDVDVVVIGGGPAGATAGRLLSEWGHAVAILTRPPEARSLAESLPPSTRKLLAHVGALELVEAAGFLPALGNTSWWGEARRRAEAFSGAPGFQVQRRDFDRLLLEAARASGAAVRGDVTVRRGDLEAAGGPALEYLGADGAARRVRARFALDCSGRAGVIARRFRVKDRRLATVAISAVWRRPAGFQGVDPTHTLVEAYADGWAWSVPLSDELRHVAVMVDPRPGARAWAAAPARQQAELLKTAHFKRILEGASLTERPWACDASVYAARAFGGERFLLVGDAGSFLDPMSSFGVKKAVFSAWMAAVVANTCLRRPENAAAARELFEGREREIAARYARESARHAQAAAARHASSFWKSRACAGPRDGPGTARGDPSGGAGEAPELLGRDDDAGGEKLLRDPALRAALESLRRRRPLRLELGDGLRFENVPEIQGREVVLAEAVSAPALVTPLRYLRGVSLPKLLRLALQHGDVGHLYEAYSRGGPPAPLPDFLAALSLLLARGMLKGV